MRERGEHCLICGIRRGFAIYETCAQEAKLWSIPIWEDAFIGGNPPHHVWTEGFIAAWKNRK